MSSKRKCPICEKPTLEPHIPFCSSRCQQVDLNRWLSDSYAIPGNQAADDSEGIPDATAEDNLGNATAGSPKTQH